MALGVATQAPSSATHLEVVLALTPDDYRAMGEHIKALRRTFAMPTSATATEVIAEAVRRQATGD
ncbi:MAG TPA: hypothetical protein VG816_13800 [Solirubrobacterales bacterium]|nr:hypothetical protein [Solirubrobacterales bacterium]